MPSSNTIAQLSFQVCPIILTGGIAAQILGAMLPMLSLFNPGGSALELPFDIVDLDDAFGAFNVLSGGTLVMQQVGKYPFANQQVAANAVIREPLTLSVIMDTPMRGPDPWATKLSVFTALKLTLDKHNNSGGLYTIATPAYLYDNCVMISLTDNSRGNASLPQNAWRFDFERPLVVLSEFQSAMNHQMSLLANQLPWDGQMTGTQTGAQTQQPQAQQSYPGVAGNLAGGPPALAQPSPQTQTGLNYPATLPVPSWAPKGIS